MTLIQKWALAALIPAFLIAPTLEARSKSVGRQRAGQYLAASKKGKKSKKVTKNNSKKRDVASVKKKGKKAKKAKRHRH